MSEPIGTHHRSRRGSAHSLYSKALLSVYDKTGLVKLAEGLSAAGVRLLGSGGTAKKIREANINVEHVV